MFIRDGFPGQRLRVLPAQLVHSALARPVTERMLVTDAGYFPHAAAHGRSRPSGAAQTIVMACADGVGWIEVDGREPARVGAGAVVVIPAGIPHRYRADSNDPWSIWWMHVQGQDADQLVSIIVGDELDPILRPGDVYSVAASIEEAVMALERDDTEPMLFIAAGAAWRTLSQLASERLRGPAHSSDRIQVVQDFLRTHLVSSFTVAELAKLAGLSVSHFSVLFKASAGIGVVAYVNRLRCARAGELLITTETSIADIAASVGYGDAFYFSRQFRALNGLSPRAFRQRSKKEAF